MSEHILFLTGKLAERSLHKVLEEMQPTEFSYDVHQLGISVAGLMTADMISRRLKETYGATRVLLPGRCRGDLATLSSRFAVPFDRGPDELKDLPMFFGKTKKDSDLSQYNVSIFAEIVDAPELTVDQILERAAVYRDDGADVIDLGCLPDTPFPHLEQSVRELLNADFKVSVDSLDPSDLVKGGHAGANFLLSINEDTLWVANEVSSIPVVIPKTPADLDSLYRVMDSLDRQNKRFIADSILDPIHFGFADSLVRYYQLRAHAPQAEIMVGIGNLTELTEADTTGINAVLMGLISEMGVNHVLLTQVSSHCRSVVREVDRARRIMHRAHEDHDLPKHIDGGLAALRELKPFPYTHSEIQDLAKEIRDPSFRIQVSADGIHIYNRDGLRSALNPFDLFPELGVEQDGSHAFYLGVELARAQIAWQLGKRYVQDQELEWGCTVPREQEDVNRYHAPGTTMKKHRKPD